MEDKDILALYWARDEGAAAAAAEKYGSYCLRVARNILGSEEDAQECVNDAWLKAWQSIPPNRPQVLSAYLAKLTRNAALSRWRRDRAEKRGGGETALVLEELEQCVSGRESVEEAADAHALADALNDFLATLSREERFLFLRRYWYADPVEAAARAAGKSEAAAAKALSRTRLKLRTYLTERGFSI